MLIGTEAKRIWKNWFGEQPTVAAGASQSSLNEFASDYAELAELMLAATIVAPTDETEFQYKRLVIQLKLRYLELRPFLLAFLRFDVQDEVIGIHYHGVGGDAFEATWAPPNLEQFARSNDVFFRDRVGRALDSLKYYNDHLTVLNEADE